MATAAHPIPAWRTVGFWLAIPIAALQGVNAVRTLIDPVGFAAYMGVAGGDPAWVQIYGLRAAFIALLVGVFLARQNLTALKWMALCALVMPIGDALITSGASASAAIVGRHAAIGVFVLITFVFLVRGERRAAVGAG